ncbi:MAG: hypothetical protein IT559_02455 [Alphaproteobacteria bacterium]|nr:hypothetical protein [Alphaproteobacteria bacterium]
MSIKKSYDDVSEATYMMARLFALDPSWKINLDAKRFNKAPLPVQVAFNGLRYGQKTDFLQIMPYFHQLNGRVIQKSFDQIGQWPSYQIIRKMKDAVLYENLALGIAGHVYPEKSEEDLRADLETLKAQDREKCDASDGSDIFRFFAQKRFEDLCVRKKPDWESLQHHVNFGNLVMFVDIEKLRHIFFPDWTGHRKDVSVSQEHLAYAQVAGTIASALEERILKQKNVPPSDEIKAQETGALVLAMTLLHHVYTDYGNFHIYNSPPWSDFLKFKAGVSKSEEVSYQLNDKKTEAEKGNAKNINAIVQGMHSTLGPLFEKRIWLENKFSFVCDVQKTSGISKIKDILGGRGAPKAHYVL